MKTLKERTEHAIAEGFTVGELAIAARKSSSAVSQWLSGQTKSLKADSAAGLEAFTGWNATWWATGKGERGEKRASRRAPTSIHSPNTYGNAERPRENDVSSTDPDQVVDALSRLLDALPEEHRDDAEARLVTLVQAPDSQRARDALKGVLGLAIRSLESTSTKRCA